MDDESLAVDADAIALGQRWAFASLRVFFEIDNLVEDLFDAGLLLAGIFGIHPFILLEGFELCGFRRFPRPGFTAIILLRSCWSPIRTLPGRCPDWTAPRA